MLEAPFFLGHSSRAEKKPQQEYGEALPGIFYHKSLHGNTEVFDPFSNKPQIVQEVEMHAPPKKFVFGALASAFAGAALSYALTSYFSGRGRMLIRPV